VLRQGRRRFLIPASGSAGTAEAAACAAANPAGPRA
jgi:hypothetical protein